MSKRDLRELLATTWRVLGEERRLEEIDRFFAEGYVRHSSLHDYGRDQFRDVLADLYRAFPDSTFRIEESVVEGDRIAYRWTSTGTHLGEYMDVPPTNRGVVATGFTISRVGADGRAVEDWASWNEAAVLHALGIIPIG